jgi:hypothetical protein
MSNDIFPFSEELIRACQIIHYTPTRVNRAQGGQRQAVNYGGGFWKLKIDLAKSDREIHDQIFAFLNAQRGRAFTFKVFVPKYQNTKGSIKVPILVKGANQITNSIAVDGLPVSTNRLLAKGDFIKFESSNKVYQLIDDLNSNPAGEGTLSLNIPIVGASPSDNEAIVYNQVHFTCALASDEVMLDLDLVLRAGWEIELEEVWN